MIKILSLTLLLALTAHADTPPIIDIFKLHGEGKTGAITVQGGVVTNVIPGTTGNTLQSNGTNWISAPAGASSSVWGFIGGTLSNQTDLNSALNDRLKPTGPWSNSTQYIPNDVVTYLGQAYYCIATHHSAAPPNPTFWVPFSTQTFPIYAPESVVGAPTYAFSEAGNDTGMGSPSDGRIDFSTNGSLAAFLENQNLTVTGNISAANFPTTGSANTLTQFDNSGALASSPWGIDPDYSGLTSVVSPPATTIGDFWQLRTQTNLSGTITNTARSLLLSLNNSGSIQDIESINTSINGPVNGNLRLLSMSSGSDTVGADTTGITLGINNPTTGSMTAMRADYSNAVGGDSVGLFLNQGTTTAGNSRVVQLSVSAPVTGGLNGIDLYSNNSVTVGGDYRVLQAGNDGAVSGFAAGVLINQGGNVTKGWTGLASYVNGNVGDGSGVNAIAFDSSFQNGKTINGTLFGFNLNNQSTVTQGIQGLNINNQGGYTGDFNVVNAFNQGVMTGNNTLRGFALSNQGAGYRFEGIDIFNNANQTEEIRGINFNTTGNSRTATGIDIQMNGQATDDAQGVRVNVSNQTSLSTTNHIRSGDFEGGTFAVQANYKPFNGTSGPVEIGNNFTATSTIDLGSPLTGADQFIQFFQSNLLANDDVSSGPIGLDTTMYGLVSQTQVASGKTVSLIRSMLLGTSLPGGSGGTLTEHVVLELLGLPSFGGAVTNPTRTGIRDAQLLGQNFCDGSTTCHFLDVRDGNAQNSFAGGVQLKTSGAQPTCDIAHRGTMWNVEGGAGVADLFQVCQKDAADVYGWVTH